jgi:hypothetical protein
MTEELPERPKQSLESRSRELVAELREERGMIADMSVSDERYERDKGYRNGVLAGVDYSADRIEMVLEEYGVAEEEPGNE